MPHTSDDEPDDDPLVELAPEEAQRLLEESYRSSSDHGSASDSRHDALAGHETPEIPGYEILGVVGRGATGVVYRARQTAVERPVALKILHRELITNRRAVKRLKREARLAAQLAHPSIISAIDMGVVDGLWWYAMELVEGVSLARRIAERGSLTERECLRLFSPLCDALQHAHEVGVVHRDIKPANILIDGRGRARLVDLGLAMGQNDPSITKTGATLGTPHYVSPEQARDPSAADIRSDLWSIGATMYHAVCGRPPFAAIEDEDDGVAEILSRVLYMPVVDPRTFAPSLSKGFALLLQKCLTRDPDQRYQEPWELVADIELLRERRRLDLRGSQVDSFASRRPRWVGRVLVVGALGLAIGGTWLLTAQPWREEADTEAVAPNLADWPALSDLKTEFDAGRVRHRSALAELAEVEAALPLEARYFANELETRIKRSLRGEASSAIGGVDHELVRALSERRFDDARGLVDETLRRELRRRTGFDGAEALPAGQLRTEATAFVTDSRRRVDDARMAAVKEATRALQAAWDTDLTDTLDGFLEAGAYRRALDWLAPAGGGPVWLERAGSGVDVTGLGADEREQIAAAIDLDLSRARTRVNAAANVAYTAALDGLGTLEEEAEKEIDDGLVTSPESAIDRLRAELERYEGEAKFEPEELPEEYANTYEVRVEAALEFLGRRESAARESLAREDLARLEREAEAAIATRDYTRAETLFTEARRDAWRATTFPELDLWLRELQLLQGLRGRVESAIERSRGATLRLTFQGFGAEGRFGTAEGEGRYVFERSGEDRPLFVRVWRPVDEPLERRERMLQAPDVRALLLGIAEVRSQEPTPLDDPEARLALASLLSLEGELARAREVLPVNDPPPGDAALVARIERRVRGEFGGPPGAANRPGGPGRPGDGPPDAGERPAPPPPKPRPLEAIYGTPNQVESGHAVRLAWDFGGGLVPADAHGFDRIVPVPEGDERLGAWRTGPWRLGYSGLVLDDPLPQPGAFFDVAGGPYLLVEEGFDTRRGVRARLWITPGEDVARGHLWSVSLFGYHAVFAEGHAWFGGGDVGDLRELYALIDGGHYGSTDAFESRSAPRLVPGRTYCVEIELRGNSLDELSIDGESIGFQPLRRRSERSDPALRLRSREPMTLLGAEVEGIRRLPR